MSQRPVEIGRLARALLRAGLSRDALERALADLYELHQRIAPVRGAAAARRACVREAAFILLWAAIERVRRMGERRPIPGPPRKATMVSDLGRDFRYGARALRRSPGFTAVALLTLALGIGANTAIFSVVDRVLLHPAPYPDADRIAVIGWDWGGGGGETWALSQVKAQFWKENGRAFRAFAITDDAQFVLTGEGEPEQVAGELVSDGYFDVIGVTPALGRGFAAEEDRLGGPAVVILTDRFWRRAFGADPDIVGRRISLDRTAHTVVGVMPPGFHGAEESNIDVLAPLRLVVDPRSQGHNYFAFGRLAPEVTRDQLASEVAMLEARFVDAYPGVVSERESFSFIGLRDLLVGDFLRTAVWLLFGAVGTILLIACANVTSLLLGRADARRREVAVRTALGAGRARVVGQVMAESLLLTLAGGALGLLFARVGLDAILALAPEGVPGLDQVGLSVPVLGFALAVSVLTGVGVGVAGALSALRSDLGALREGGRGQTSSAGRIQVRGLLIMGESAFSVVLLVGAGLLLASFFRLRAVDLGFEPEGLFAMEVRLPTDRYGNTEATWRFESQVLERLRALPGVTAAGSAANLPLVRGPNLGVTVLSPGERQHDVVEFRAVSPDFLDILGTRLVAGRGFDQSDGAASPPVAVVNEAFVRRFFTNEEALGATISIDGPERVVVGVLRDVRDMDLRRDARPTVFAPRSQAGDGATRVMNDVFAAAFAIRVEDARGLEAAFRRAVQDVDPDQPILRMRPMTEVVMASIARERFNVRLFVTFGALAMVLTAIGVYGVVSYSVGLRTHEIGLRMALGARRGGVVGLVVSRGMVMVLIGVAIGLLAASAASRLLAGMLFGVSPGDPAIFAGVACLIATVALVASYVPARRASRVDPMIALRAD